MKLVKVSVLITSAEGRPLVMEEIADSPPLMVGKINYTRKRG